jgi:hypothetical protein
MTRAIVWTITEGDKLDFERAQQNVEAIKAISARQPWKAASLRSALHEELRKMRTLAMRYDV